MKYLFLLVTFISFISSSAFAETQQNQSTSVSNQLENLEKKFDGKIGVYAIDTNDNQIIAHRASERFPFQSTSKLIGVAALLKQSEKNKDLLQEVIHYQKSDLGFWDPVTGKHLTQGMTLAALSEAAITYSDNSAINLIIKKLGGLAVVTDFAHSIGNQTFNMTHYEPNLNSDPNNPEDTSTPEDMAMSLQKITLGNLLAPPQRTQLIAWMRNNTTSNHRMRAGVPLGWDVADKTGSGGIYGIANDIGIVWSPECKPIVLTIYTYRNQKTEKSEDDVIAKTTAIILNGFAKKDTCLQQAVKFNLLFTGKGVGS
jgi:beta-lactamase class A